MFVVVSMHRKDRIVLEVGDPDQEVCAYRVPWVFLCSFSLLVLGLLAGSLKESCDFGSFGYLAACVVTGVRFSGVGVPGGCVLSACWVVMRLVWRIAVSPSRVWEL